jgi:hypothetical protein
MNLMPHTNASLQAWKPASMQIEPPSDQAPARRDEPQAHSLGALALLLIDGSCRAQLLNVEPTFAHLLLSCQYLPGYSAEAQATRRKSASRIFLACIQRDSYARQCIVEQVRQQCLTSFRL